MGAHRIARSRLCRCMLAYVYDVWCRATVLRQLHEHLFGVSFRANHDRGSGMTTMNEDATGFPAANSIYKTIETEERNHGSVRILGSFSDSSLTGLQARYAGYVNAVAIAQEILRCGLKRRSLDDPVAGQGFARSASGTVDRRDCCNSRSRRSASSVRTRSLTEPRPFDLERAVPVYAYKGSMLRHTCNGIPLAPAFHKGSSYPNWGSVVLFPQQSNNGADRFSGMDTSNHQFREQSLTNFSLRTADV